MNTRPALLLVDDEPRSVEVMARVATGDLALVDAATEATKR